jgi:hypothetical protein
VGGAGGKVADGARQRSSESEMEQRTHGTQQRGSRDPPAWVPLCLRVIPEGQYSQGQIVIKKYTPFILKLLSYCLFELCLTTPFILQNIMLNIQNYK